MNKTPFPNAGAYAPATIVASLEASSTKYETPCGNGQMVWRRWGDGPPVVLLHGGGGSWTHWIHNIGPLSARYTVWAMDLPGLGDSAMLDPLSIESIAESVERGLNILLPGVMRLDLVGFSFGNSIATIIATQMASRVRNLVLVAARFASNPNRVQPELISWKKVQDPVNRLQVHRRNLEILMIANPDSIDDLAVYLQSENTTRARFSGLKLVPGPQEKLHEYLPRVRVHKRITGISGSKDQAAVILMDDQESALLAIQPDARFEQIENAGHWVQYEAAEHFNQCLLATLAD